MKCVCCLPRQRKYVLVSEKMGQNCESLVYMLLEGHFPYARSVSLAGPAISRFLIHPCHRAHFESQTPIECQDSQRGPVLYMPVFPSSVASMSSEGSILKYEIANGLHLYSPLADGLQFCFSFTLYAHAHNHGWWGSDHQLCN